MADDDPIQRYENCLRRMSGGDPRVLSAAQELGRRCAVPSSIVPELFSELESRWWQTPATRSNNNWRWRRRSELGRDSWARMPEASEDDKMEVRLERDLVRRAGLEDWTFQMSTMSGLVAPHAHKRRAIDLVHRVALSHFEFIELKTGSDNPVFAAFEIVAYGLAWCRAREHLPPELAPTQFGVLAAKRIDLVVLAPESWYRYRTKAGAVREYCLGSLAANLNEGLSLVAGGIPGLDRLALFFRSYADRRSLMDAAKAGVVGTHVA